MAQIPPLQAQASANRVAMQSEISQILTSEQRRRMREAPTIAVGRQ